MVGQQIDAACSSAASIRAARNSWSSWRGGPTGRSQRAAGSEYLDRSVPPRSSSMQGIGSPLEMAQQALEDVAKQCDLALAEEVDKVAAHGGS
jgi:hypothetical protein